MIDFCVRPDIYPTTEEFPMDKIKETIQYLKEAETRFRIVLKK